MFVTAGKMFAVNFRTFNCHSRHAHAAAVPCQTSCEHCSITVYINDTCASDYDMLSTQLYSRSSPTILAINVLGRITGLPVNSSIWDFILLV